MTVAQQLRRLFDAVVTEAEQNPAFAARLQQALTILAAAPAPAPTIARPDASAALSPAPSMEAAAPRRRGGRRPPGVLDPFAVYQEGEDALRTRLTSLGLDELKDIVAEHGMDPSKVSMKWKKAERLVDLVVATVRERLEKGDAFGR